jgi:hypothetical protein
VRRAGAVRAVELAVALGLVAIVAAACGEEGRTTGQMPTRAELDPTELVGGTWRPPHRPELGDPTIVERCGDPLLGLGLPDAGVRASATSRTLEAGLPSSPTPNGATTPLPMTAPVGDEVRPPAEAEQMLGGVVRLAVTSYENEGAARAATGAVDASAFGRCLVGAVDGYLADKRARPGMEGVVLPDATAQDFETTESVVHAGDDGKLFGARFYEDLLGGHDNIHRCVLAVARRGAVVATAIVAVNDQLLDQDAGDGEARRLVTAVLERAS